jgi:hypothetical protein
VQPRHRYIALITPFSQPMDEPMLVDGASLTLSPSATFTDEQHKEQDDKVTQDALVFFKEEQPELSLIECMILLVSIINRSEGKLKDMYKDIQTAAKLLREHDKLVSALQEAWRSRNYKAIRESGEFQALSLQAVNIMISLNLLPAALLTMHPYNGKRTSHCQF